MSALVDPSATHVADHGDPLLQSIELLLAAIAPPAHLVAEYESIRGKLIDHQDSDVANLIDQVTILVAKSQLHQEQKHLQLRETNDTAGGLVTSLEQSITATETLAQSSFQGAQKTVNAMERQIHDIAYRLKISNSIDGMKLWMEQRLSILQARLDDFEAHGLQQQVSLASQLQKISKNVRDLGSCIPAGESGDDTSVGTQYLSRYVDSLTGLDNRLGFEASIARLIENRQQQNPADAVMAMCDVDGMGEINREHGTEAGDEVLRTVARKLRGVVGSGNYLARFGSDRFVVLLFNTDIDAGHLVADKICETIESAVVEWNQMNLRATVACGYSELRKGDSRDGICQRVEQALTGAKLAGGNCCWFNDLP